MRDSEATTPAQAGQATAPFRRPRDETAQLGDEIYERDIRKLVEANHHGEFISIDVDSGGWAVSDDLLTAAKRVRGFRHPGRGVAALPLPHFCSCR